MSGKLDRMMDEIDQLEDEARSLEAPDARLIVPVIGVLRELLVRWETDQRMGALDRIEKTVQRIDTDGTSLVDVHAAMKTSSQNLRQASTNLTKVHDVHQLLGALIETVKEMKREMRAAQTSFRDESRAAERMAKNAKAYFHSINLWVLTAMVILWAVSWVGAMWSLRAWTPRRFLTEEQQAQMMTEEDRRMINRGTRFGTVWWTPTPEQREALNEAEGWTYPTQQKDEGTEESEGAK